MNEFGIDKYFEFFFSIYNPVFLSLIFFMLLFLVAFVSYRYIYNPLLVKHSEEKENLEFKNARLLTLFSEMDPNPIIRLNPNGDIVEINKSAKETFEIDAESQRNINYLIESFEIDLKELINKNNSTVFTRIINNRFYEINVHGISLLDMAQLYFYDRTESKKHEEQMHTYQNLLKQSSAQLTTVLEEERSKLAGILHDSIGQNLLLIRLSLQNLKKQNSNGKSSEEFKTTFTLLDETVTEIKEIARRIRPLSLDELGLNTVITSICKKVSKESGIITHIHLPDENIKIPKDMEVCIYRVTQESLNNIMKHSKANNFTVNLSIEPESISLIISDDGIGFKPTILFNDKYISEGMGLLNMQENVERLGGTFHIESKIDNGCTLVINFPYGQNIDEKRINYKSAGR